MYLYKDMLVAAPHKQTLVTRYVSVMLDQLLQPDMWASPQAWNCFYIADFKLPMQAAFGLQD